MSSNSCDQTGDLSSNANSAPNTESPTEPQPLTTTPQDPKPNSLSANDLIRGGHKLRRQNMPPPNLQNKSDTENHLNNNNNTNTYSHKHSSSQYTSSSISHQPYSSHSSHKHSSSQSTSSFTSHTLSNNNPSRDTKKCSNVHRYCDCRNNPGEKTLLPTLEWSERDRVRLTREISHKRYMERQALDSNIIDGTIFNNRNEKFQKTWKCNCNELCPAYEVCHRCKGLRRFSKPKKRCPTKQLIRSTKPMDKKWIHVLNNFEYFKHIVLHNCRRQSHIINVIDEDNNIDGYLESTLRAVIKTFKVEKAKREGDYRVFLTCPKDKNVKGKECGKKVNARVVEFGLYGIEKTMPVGDERTRIEALRIMFEEEMTLAKLTFDRKRVIDEIEQGLPDVYAYYSQCIRDGCKYVNGFHCDPKDREAHYVWVNFEREGLCYVPVYEKFVICPDPNCQKNGERTRWCSLCGKQHLEHEPCGPLDPRSIMSKEELAERDKQIREGTLQVCTCGAYYGKESNTCDYITCVRPSCGRGFCFGCGDDLKSVRHLDHMAVGPIKGEVEEGFGCKNRFVIDAASNLQSEFRDKVRDRIFTKDGVEKLQDLFAFSALRVFTDHLRPLEEGDGKVWLSNLIDNAKNDGQFGNLILNAATIQNADFWERGKKMIMREEIANLIDSEFLMQQAQTLLNQNELEVNGRNWLQDIVDRAIEKGTIK